MHEPSQILICWFLVGDIWHLDGVLDRRGRVALRGNAARTFSFLSTFGENCLFFVNVPRALPQFCQLVAFFLRFINFWHSLLTFGEQLLAWGVHLDGVLDRRGRVALRGNAAGIPVFLSSFGEKCLVFLTFGVFITFCQLLAFLLTFGEQLVAWGRTETERSMDAAALLCADST